MNIEIGIRIWIEWIESSSWTRISIWEFISLVIVRSHNRTFSFCEFLFGQWFGCCCLEKSRSIKYCDVHHIDLYRVFPCFRKWTDGWHNFVTLVIWRNRKMLNLTVHHQIPLCNKVVLLFIVLSICLLYFFSFLLLELTITIIV